MNSNQTNPEVRESTYALLIRSEEKKRNLFENIAYGLFIVSAVAAIGQFALQPVNLSNESTQKTVSTTQVVPVQS